MTAELSQFVSRCLSVGTHLFRVPFSSIVVAIPGSCAYVRSTPSALNHALVTSAQTSSTKELRDALLHLPRNSRRRLTWRRRYRAIKKRFRPHLGHLSREDGQRRRRPHLVQVIQLELTTPRCTPGLKKTERETKAKKNKGWPSTPPAAQPAMPGNFPYKCHFSLGTSQRLDLRPGQCPSFDPLRSTRQRGPLRINHTIARADLSNLARPHTTRQSSQVRSSLESLLAVGAIPSQSKRRAFSIARVVYINLRPACPVCPNEDDERSRIDAGSRRRRLHVVFLDCEENLILLTLLS
ncbi:hypothetical protein CpipJ_CPIJ018755 [Culex quinquefasciatus]|uniref:Uncharacterized protein n=1 Tax=Culex quinquefasciatus TaxID=7176 RepID=B0XHB6_CULQU|nr:hypothetical protein CpipJ_CPIJ018755 [Culex quinquefasciatus]|eukprot:XP_001869038.1 hypothetical protein CpipJ_CPIJ018755 [Culex quinquefasciatus]